jgi:colanic acid biosynthesis glycosyl transferase WcaI
MKIAIVDYSGHPFQVQLSRELVRRNHVILHLYFSDFQTPKGRLAIGQDDPATLAIEAVSLGVPFEKYSLLRRRAQEIHVGRKFAERVRAFAPEVVVASNLPLDALRILEKQSSSQGSAFVFWQQDIYSVAIGRILSKRFGPVGALLGRHYKSVERAILRKSSAVVAIAPEFAPVLKDVFRLSPEKIHIVENWAPLDEITPRPKRNSWSESHGLADKTVLLYTGTLGMKHNPELILLVAEHLRNRNDFSVLVASEGPAADWLVREAQKRSLSALHVIGFQPFSEYSDVLGSADILIAILENDAGVFSVPSKVLSYLCSGRAIVLSAPQQNLSTKTVNAAHAGITVPAGDAAGMVAAVDCLINDPQRRTAAAKNAREYAEKTFDIATIGNKFEQVFACALMRRK